MRWTVHHDDGTKAVFEKFATEDEANTRCWQIAATGRFPLAFESPEPPFPDPQSPRNATTATLATSARSTDLSALDGGKGGNG